MKAFVVYAKVIPGHESTPYNPYEVLMTQVWGRVLPKNPAGPRPQLGGVPPHAHGDSDRDHASVRCGISRMKSRGPIVPE